MQYMWKKTMKGIKITCKLLLIIQSKVFWGFCFCLKEEASENLQACEKNDFQKKEYNSSFTHEN